MNKNINIGSYQCNELLNFLEYSFKHDLIPSFFKEKDHTTRNQGSEHHWNLFGSEKIHKDLHESSRMGIEVALDIPIGQISSKEFALNDSAIKDLMDIQKLHDRDKCAVQTVQKLGETYTVISYGIENTSDGYRLIPRASSKLSPEQFKVNFPFEKEYGHVSFITSFDTIPFLFRHINGAVPKKLKKMVLYNDRLVSDFNAPNLTVQKRMNTMFSTKILLEILVKKKFINIDMDFINKMTFRTHYLLGTIYAHGISSYLYFGEMEVESFDTDKNVYDIIQKPYDNNIISKNFMNPFDILSYNSTISKTDSGIDVVHSFDVLDPSIPFAEIGKAVEVALDASLDQVNSTITFLDIEKEYTPELLKEEHTHIYSESLEKLSKKWNRYLKTFRKIYKTSPGDENVFALKFIRKFFIPLFQNINRVTTYMENPNEVVVEYFRKNYGSFEEFFGIDDLSKYMRILTGLKSSCYMIDNGRITDVGADLSSILNGHNRYRLNIKNIFPKYNDAHLKSSHASIYYNKSVNCIIVNDGGTKQAWKVKVREYVKRMKSDHPKLNITFMILDPLNKLELILLRKAATMSSIIVMFSSFESTITIQKKPRASPKTAISHFTYNSFSSHKSKPKAFTQELSLFNPSEMVVIEYMVSKNTVEVMGKSYPHSQLNLKTWVPIIKEYTGRDIYLMSKANVKKLKEAHDNIFTMDDLLLDPDTPKLFEDMQYSYIFHGGINSYTNINIILNFMASEVISPLYNRKHAMKNLKYWYLIMDSFDLKIREFLNMLTLNIETSVKASHNSYIISDRLHKKMISIDVCCQYPLSKLVFDTLTSKLDTNRYDDIIVEFAESIRTVSNDRTPNKRSIFGLTEMNANIEVVLEHSKYLNLNKDETTLKINTLINYYLNRWILAVDMIESHVKDTT